MRVKNYLKASFIGSVVLVVAGSILLLSSIVYYDGKNNDEKNKLTLPVASIKKATASPEEVDAIIRLLSSDISISSGAGKSVEISYAKDVVHISVKSKADYSKFTMAISKLNFLASPYQVEIQSLCLGSESCKSQAFYDFTGALVKKEVTWN